MLAYCNSTHIAMRMQHVDSADWMEAGLQPLLARLLTVDLRGVMLVPRRLEINIPPAVTTVSEAAVGHDVVMRAVASAVLQVTAMATPMLR